MDHENLLAKYIQYIGEIEGTDYLGFDCAPVPFTENEWDELRRLASPRIVEADELEIRDNTQQLPDCPFGVMERFPCDPLYKLVSVEEEEDGTITMVLELVEEKDA